MQKCQKRLSRWYLPCSRWGNTYVYYIGSSCPLPVGTSNRKLVFFSMKPTINLRSMWRILYVCERISIPRSILSWWSHVQWRSLWLARKCWMRMQWWYLPCWRWVCFILCLSWRSSISKSVLPWWTIFQWASVSLRLAWECWMWQFRKRPGS